MFYLSVFAVRENKIHRLDATIVCITLQYMPRPRSDAYATLDILTIAFVTYLLIVRCGIDRLITLHVKLCSSL